MWRQVYVEFLCYNFAFSLTIVSFVFMSFMLLCSSLSYWEWLYFLFHLFGFYCCGNFLMQTVFICLTVIYHVCRPYLIDSVLYRTEPPQIAKFLSFSRQSKNSDFVLTCSVIQGNKPLQFEWYKDGHRMDSKKPIDSPPRYQIDTKNSFSLFNLNHIESHDSGNYSCVVSNQYGFDTQWSVLQVKGLMHQTVLSIYSCVA